jgi:hypothetical protein
MTRTAHITAQAHTANWALSERPCASVGRLAVGRYRHVNTVVCRLVHCTLRRCADTFDADSSERTEDLLLQRGLAPPVLLIESGSLSGRPSPEGALGQYGPEGALRPFCPATCALRAPALSRPMGFPLDTI